MPLSGSASYVPTAEEFIGHWNTADATLGVGNEIVLPGGVTVAGLTTQKDLLVAKQADLQSVLNDKESKRGEVELTKASLLVKLNGFIDKVRAFFEGSKWINALPSAPNQGDGQGRFVRPMDDVQSLWAKINADPATASPIILQDGTTQATFGTELDGLKADYSTLNANEVTVKVTREERNDLQDVIRDLLVSYRKVLPTFFPKEHALVESLPRVTPLPGGTPAGVTLTAVWDPVTMQVKLTWTASTDPNLLHYEVRFVPGPTYNTEDEAMDTTIVPPAALEHFTVSGLSGPGSTASYKVYVVLTTGNEKGSNAVAVTQP